jgi:hypothetical protein
MLEISNMIGFLVGPPMDVDVSYKQIVGYSLSGIKPHWTEGWLPATNKVVTR